MSDTITVEMLDGKRYVISGLSGFAAVERLIELYGDLLPDPIVKPCGRCKKHHEYCDEGMAHCKANGWKCFQDAADSTGVAADSSLVPAAGCLTCAWRGTGFCMGFECANYAKKDKLSESIISTEDVKNTVDGK